MSRTQHKTRNLWPTWNHDFQTKCRLDTCTGCGPEFNDLLGSLTFRELSKIIPRKYTMPVVTFMLQTSSWNFVSVPKASLGAHAQSFSKFWENILESSRNVSETYPSYNSFHGGKPKRPVFLWGQRLYQVKANRRSRFGPAWRCASPWRHAQTLIQLWCPRSHHLNLHWHTNGVILKHNSDLLTLENVPNNMYHTAKLVLLHKGAHSP